jgi:Flagellin and related hook-associated proteins
MKTSFISSLAVQNAMRLTLNRSQSEISSLQREIVTGRHDDIGVALGSSAGRSVTLNRDVARLQTIRDSNSIVTQRLSASQSALTLMADNAQNMLEAFIAVTGTDDRMRLGIAKQELTDALEAFIAAANTSSNGEYIFSGVNTDTKPLDNYFAPGSPAKVMFDTTFAAYFGFAQNDPAAAGITAAQMDDFLTNVVTPTFMGAGWTASWSSASDNNVTSRISRTELIESSTNMNTAGMRNFALAAVIGIELLDSPLSSEARAVVNSHAIQHAGEAVTGIDNVRSKLGVSENRVAKANTALEAQIKIVKLHIGDLEGVDAYEASTRMNSLLAQVETSYQLTARIQRLSLADFL